MEPLSALIAELDADLAARQQQMPKAERVRHMIWNMSKFIGMDRLCKEAVYDFVCEKVPDLGKGYFTNIVRKTWNVEIDEYGVEWIRVDRPKGRWHR